MWLKFQVNPMSGIRLNRSLKWPILGEKGEKSVEKACAILLLLQWEEKVSAQLAGARIIFFHTISTDSAGSPTGKKEQKWSHLARAEIFFNLPS